MSVISEEYFREKLLRKLPQYLSKEFKSVTGPGRSGAIAAVYASHLLKIPFIPYGVAVPDKLRPVLVVDTAIQSGKTLRKAVKKMGAAAGIALFHEPPRVHFWYEMV